MKRRLAYLLLGSVILALSCAKGTPEPVAPPGNLGPSVNPRFDGIYGAPVKGTNGGRDLLHFREGGQVFGLSAVTESAAKRAESLVRDGERRCARGTWTVTDGVLRFSLKSPSGVVDYAGAVQGDRLTVKWRSDINGASEEEEYAFLSTGGASAPPPVSPDAGVKDAGVEEPPDAEAPPSAGSLVPEGTGWFCFKAGGASRCERRQASCESARRTATAVRKDTKTTARCARQTSAWCFVVQRAGGLGAASCAASEGDCDAERASVSADTDTAEVSVSGCSRQ